MARSEQIGLSDLESRLGGIVPAIYREFVESTQESVLVERGFEPRTLLVLNLELRSWDHIESTGRLFLNGDGCGNYYFCDLAPNTDRVMLWSHDPPGIEDPTLILGPYLREAEQLCRIDWPVRAGKLCICRTAQHGASILDPIRLDEWLEAVAETSGVVHVGYREGYNPFTRDTMRFESPGLSRITGQASGLVSFHYGRAELDDGPEQRALATRLAEKLHARVLSAS